MGTEFAEPSDANPDGFYEEMGVWWVHARLFRELGMSNFWRPGRWPWRSTVLAMASGYREEMRAVIAGAADGWKDPGFAVILEAWLPFLPARPKVVVCLRSPQAHTASVSRLYGLVDGEMVDRQWARHYRRLLDVIRDYELDATCVEYDALVEHPEPVERGAWQPDMHVPHSLRRLDPGIDVVDLLDIGVDLLHARVAQRLGPVACVLGRRAPGVRRRSGQRSRAAAERQHFVVQAKVSLRDGVPEPPQRRVHVLGSQRASHELRQVSHYRLRVLHQRIVLHAGGRQLVVADYV